jgi:hypothetical protein
MKRTQKYSQACQILTFPHINQDELYEELNRLGWYWQPKNKKWERDDTPAREATDLIRVRVMAVSAKIDEVAQHFAEASSNIGLRLVEQSQAYPCRPPNQNESRIYLTFEDLQTHSLASRVYPSTC